MKELLEIILTGISYQIGSIKVSFKVIIDLLNQPLKRKPLRDAQIQHTTWNNVHISYSNPKLLEKMAVFPDTAAYFNVTSAMTYLPSRA